MGLYEEFDKIILQFIFKKKKIKEQTEIVGNKKKEWGRIWCRKTEVKITMYLRNRSKNLL